ncbi:ABC transporter ATP-binding protein [Treponema pedis]|uniref:ABC transporter ATP-binding protein n=1 Tax=Treponema pedis TaxID=409322 RepID=UPI0004259B22|nr:ABC transporter ATP-binding protein [Treponema pedis]
MKKYLKQYLPETIFVWFLGCISSGFSIIGKYYAKDVLDSVATFDLNLFFRAIAVVCGIYAVGFLVNYIHEVIRTKTVQKTLLGIRCDLAQKISSSTYTGFHKKHTGEYSSWFEADMGLVEQNGLVPVFQIVTSISAFIISFISLISIHWIIAVLAVAEGVILLFLPKLFEKGIAAGTKKVMQTIGTFTIRIQDLLLGFDTLFSFNKRKLIPEEIHTAGTERAKDMVKLIKKHIVSAIVIAAVGILFYLSIIGVTGYLAIKGLVTIGTILATAQIADVLSKSLSEFSGYIIKIKSVKPVFEKFESLEQENEKQLSLPSFKKDFYIQNLNFSYDNEGKKILSNLNMNFELGKKYGIIGESGSGKTTMFKLLNGMLNEYTGGIYYDGEELSNLDKKTLREQVAYIDQNVYIFNRTIRENICLGSNFSNEELEKAIKDAALEPVIKECENGLDTIVEQNGQNFSGGQRQRIALARALIHGRKILLIDEGTSALDEKNAAEIEEKLLNNKDLTVIMVSHHFSEAAKSKLDAIYKI